MAIFTTLLLILFVYLLVFVLNYKMFACLDQIANITSDRHRKESLLVSSLFLIGTLVAVAVVLVIVYEKYNIGEKTAKGYAKTVKLPFRKFLMMLEKCPPNFEKRDKENGS